MATRETRGRAVLWLDDEPIVIDSHKHVLSREGFEVHGTFDGPTALAMVRSMPIRLILLDYKLRGMSGLDVLRTLRAEGNRTPAILVTAFLSATLQDEAFEAGAMNCVGKPIDIPGFVATFRTAIETRPGASRARDGSVHRMHVRVDTREHHLLFVRAQQSGLTMAGEMRRILRNAMQRDRVPYHALQGAPPLAESVTMATDRVQLRFDATQHEVEYLNEAASYCGMSVNSFLRILIRRYFS
jgi:two-component system response regulator AdeR